jgi:hypothetical protein
MPILKDIAGMMKDRFKGLLSNPDNRSAELDKKDFKTDPKRDWSPEQEVEDRKDIAFIKDFVDRSARQRQTLEREWVLSVAQSQGRQWLAFDDSLSRTISLIDDEYQDKYITDPIIRPYFRQWLSLITMTQPDASPVAETRAPINVDAAREGRVILGHVRRSNSWNQLTKDKASWCGLTGAFFECVYWDPNAFVGVPTYGPDGMVSGKQSSQSGDVCMLGCPSFEVYLDPAAKKWRDNKRLCRVRSYQPSVLEEKYDLEPGGIECDTDDGKSSYTSPWESYGSVRNNPGSSSNNNGEKNKLVTVYEFWEAPTPRYPRDGDDAGGRLIVCTAKKVLYRGSLPLNMEPDERIPIPGWHRTVYEEAPDHPYGRSLIADVIPLQVAYNRLLTRVLERIEEDKLTAAVPMGANIPPDSYERVDNGRNVRLIHYDAIEGGPPSFQQPPPVTKDLWELREVLRDDIMTHFGIHEPTMGESGSATSGIAIELTQQSDRTSLRGFLDNLLESEGVLADMVIHCYGQYASPHVERLMGLDPSGNAEESAKAAMAFTAITAGGKCSVQVTPGSNVPKTPSGQNQEILQFFQMGLLDPMNPAATIAIKLMSYSRSDELLEMMAVAQEEEAAKQQQLMQDQAQMQMDAEAQKMQMQAQLAPPPPEAPPVPPDPREMAALQQEADMAKMQVQGEQQAMMEMMKQEGATLRDKLKIAGQKEIAKSRPKPAKA